MRTGFNHIDNHYQIRFMTQELEAKPGNATENKDWEFILDLARESAASSHGEAALIQTACRVPPA